MTSMVSIWLAEAAKADAPPTELKDVVPEPYLDFWDVFSKESFDELPEQKQWDHAIDLIPGSKPFSTKVYPISLSNRKNSMTSSTKTYQAATSIPQNC